MSVYSTRSAGSYVSRSVAPSADFWPALPIVAYAFLDAALTTGLGHEFSRKVTYALVLAMVGSSLLLRVPIARTQLTIGAILSCLAAAMSLIFLGTVTGSLAGNDSWSVLRDVMYFSTQPLALLAGYLLGLRFKTADGVVVSIIACGTVVSVVYIVAAAGHIDLLLNSREDFRRIVGYGFEISFFAAIVGVYYLAKARQPAATKLWLTCCVLVCIVGALLPSSRGFAVNAIFLVILMLSGRFRWVVFLVMVALLLSLQLLFSTPLYENFISTGEMYSLLSSTPRGIRELVQLPYTSRDDIVAYWRAYEGARGYIAFGAGTFFEKLFGLGFGYYVELGTVPRLVSSTQQIVDAPILHNGIASVLVKAGVLGLLLYYLFLLRLVAPFRKLSRSKVPAMSAMGLCLAGAIAMLLFQTPLTHGWLNPNAGLIMMVLGLILSQTGDRDHGTHPAQPPSPVNLQRGL